MGRRKHQQGNLNGDKYYLNPISTKYTLSNLHIDRGTLSQILPQPYRQGKYNA